MYLHNVRLVEVVLQRENCEARGRLKQHQDFLGQAGICIHVSKFNTRRNNVPRVDHSLIQISQAWRQLWIRQRMKGPFSKPFSALLDLTGRRRKWRGAGCWECVESNLIENRVARSIYPPWHGCASTTALESFRKRKRSKVWYLIVFPAEVGGIDRGG
jgi:hypothetical protein